MGLSRYITLDICGEAQRCAPCFYWMPYPDHLQTSSLPEDYASSADGWVKRRTTRAAADTGQPHGRPIHVCSVTGAARMSVSRFYCKTLRYDRVYPYKHYRESCRLSIQSIPFF